MLGTVEGSRSILLTHALPRRGCDFPRPARSGGPSPERAQGSHSGDGGCLSSRAEPTAGVIVDYGHAGGRASDCGPSCSSSNSSPSSLRMRWLRPTDQTGSYRSVRRFRDLTRHSPPISTAAATPGQASGPAAPNCSRRVVPVPTGMTIAKISGNVCGNLEAYRGNRRIVGSLHPSGAHAATPGRRCRAPVSPLRRPRRGAGPHPASRRVRHRTAGRPLTERHRHDPAAEVPRAPVSNLSAAVLRTSVSPDLDTVLCDVVDILGKLVREGRVGHHPANGYRIAGAETTQPATPIDSVNPAQTLRFPDTPAIPGNRSREPPHRAPVLHRHTPPAIAPVNNPVPPNNTSALPSVTGSTLTRSLAQGSAVGGQRRARERLARGGIAGGTRSRASASRCWPPTAIAASRGRTRRVALQPQHPGRLREEREKLRRRRHRAPARDAADLAVGKGALSGDVEHPGHGLQQTSLQGLNQIVEVDGLHLRICTGKPRRTPMRQRAGSPDPPRLPASARRAVLPASGEDPLVGSACGPRRPLAAAPGPGCPPRIPSHLPQVPSSLRRFHESLRPLQPLLRRAAGLGGARRRGSVDRRVTANLRYADRRHRIFEPGVRRDGSQGALEERVAKRRCPRTRDCIKGEFTRSGCRHRRSGDLPGCSPP